MGLYPGRCGTHSLFFNRDRDAKPGGAVVIGLGQVGELTPGLLTTGTRDAMLDYALRIAQWPDDRFGPADHPRSAALTCLLVGTGAGGMSVRDSLEAILRGAVAANARLVEAELEDKVLIDSLEFLELFEDAAIAAAEGLAALLTDGQLAMEVAWPERVVVEGEGRLRRVRCDDLADWWHRLEIIEDPERQMLRFIATTDRARAEETLATGQLRLADSFIRQASQSPGANPEVAKTLFEMLLPNRLKELAPRQADLVLLVDAASARYPWELLEDRWSHTGRPPAVAAGLVRQLKTTTFRAQPAHATQPTALVVGNPDLAGWDKFPDLPGARQEAQNVAALLNAHGYRALDCIDERADTILSCLHKDAWRILHLAGHGEFEFPLEGDGAVEGAYEQAEQASAKRKKCVSGMVIGRNTFLTPGDVEQMRWVPELVFINCCHLGKVQGRTKASNERRYGLLASNLAVQFILMGVKAVVAAGWAVDDAAGLAFAESFYRHLLAGEAFGDAVRAAREETWVRYPEVNTWGAYQCYGDPGYRLRSDGAGTGTWAPKPYHAPAQLISDLQNYTEWIRMRMRRVGDDDVVLADLRDGIGRYLAAVPPEQSETWLARADVAAAMGFAWGETRAWSEAVEWLERALRADAGDCPMRAVEQSANYRVRLAGERWQAMRSAAGDEAPAGRMELVREIESAIRELDVIAQRAPTVERLSLLGSACKRLAWARAGTQADLQPRLEALVNMAHYYRQAYELDPQPNPYPFSSWAVARLLSAWLDPDQAREGAWRASLNDECLRMIEVAGRRNEQRPSFWNSVGVADCELARLLNRTGIEAAEAARAASRIVELYRDAAQRGASPREYSSVQEHLDFVIALGDTLPGALREALESIRRAL